MFPLLRSPGAKRIAPCCYAQAHLGPSDSGAAAAAAGGRLPSAEAKDMQEQMQQRLEDAYVVYETHKDQKRFCRE
jgi:hypothetical protein